MVNVEFGIILFDSNVLQLRSETVAVCRRMNVVLDIDNHMIPARMRSTFPDIFLIIEENPGKTLTRKLTRPEFEPGTAG